MRTLRHAANTLRMPELRDAFAGWARVCEDSRLAATLAAQAEEGARSLRLELASATAELRHAQAKIEHLTAAARADKEAALEALRVELTGTADEQAAARERRERQLRIEAFSSRFARRLLHHSVARGWASWVSAWEARVAARALCRFAASRLRHPVLADAMAVWVEVVRAERQAAAAAVQRQHWSGLAAERAELAVALQRARDEASAALVTLQAQHADELERLRIELSGTAAEQAAARAAAEKEGRVELLRGQAMRRMMHHELRRGWSRWQHAWRHAVLAREAATRGAVEEREEATRKQVETLVEELSAVRTATERAALRHVEEQRIALERQRVDLMGSAEERARARTESEREARVELLRRQIARRMVHAGKASAWGAWHGWWARRVVALGQLRHATAMLRYPRIAAAYHLWAARAEESRRRAERRAQKATIAGVESERAEIEAELRQAREEARARAQQASAERIQLLDQIAKLSGGAAEADALIAARAMAEREERIELFRRQVLRRMLYADYAKSWTAWTDFSAARRAALATIRRATNRMRTPTLADAFDVWVAVWAGWVREARVTDVMRREAALREELEAVRETCEARVAALEESREREIARQVTELTGSASERIEARLQREREGRVELMRRQFARRGMYADLAQGWAAWLSLWEARTHALGWLADCGQRLRKPELSHAFRWWIQAWQDEKHAAELRTLELESKSLDAQLRQARFEAGQVRKGCAVLCCTYMLERWGEGGARVALSPRRHRPPTPIPTYPIPMHLPTLCSRSHCWRTAAHDEDGKRRRAQRTARARARAAQHHREPNAGTPPEERPHRSAGRGARELPSSEGAGGDGGQAARGGRGRRGAPARGEHGAARTVARPAAALFRG